MTTDTAALMPQAQIDDAMLASMRAKIGVQLRIDHSVNNDYASRVAVAKFAGGVGDINQLGERIARIRWHVINFERGPAATRRAAADGSRPKLPHRWTAAEVADIEARVLAESPRGAEPRYWEDVEVGDKLDVLTKGPIGLTDEIAFVAGGGTPIPRLKAHAAALHDYRAHAAWAFRDPVTSALEPIYSVHYNIQAANAMSAEYMYDVGFQRQSWQVQHLTSWSGDDGWVKSCSAQYRKFVYVSDVIELTGEITDKTVDADGEHIVHVRTAARNQRGETVMPGRAIVALPTRDGSPSPAARRAR